MFKADVFEVPCGTEKSSKILGGVFFQLSLLSSLFINREVVVA